MDQTTLNAIFQQHRDLRRQMAEIQAQYASILKSCKDRPMSVKDQIDSIPGRRVPYMLSGTLSFTESDDGTRAAAINCLVSQDGPMIWTHYPLVAWRPNSPSNATNFGRWRPVMSWPLPTQQVTSDFIDISGEIIDGGTQRNFQNAAVMGPWSRPDCLIPLPEWCTLAPNTTIQFVPTFEAINFNSGGTATEGGILQVVFPGFRVVAV